MGFNSQTGQVGFGVQTLKGTPVAATRFAKLRGGGLGAERQLLVPDPEVGGHRDVTQASLGPVAFSGDVEFYPRMQMLAMLLYGVLGDSVDSVLAEGNQHVLTGADTIPWLTVEERISNTFESMRYTDVKVNSLRLEAEAAGFFMGSANLLGLGGASGFAAQGSPTYDSTPLMVGTQVTVDFDGATLPAKSFNFEINNNLEGEDFTLGSLYAQDATEKRRDITAGVNYRPADSDLWKAAMWGDSAIDVPQSGPAYEGPLQIVASSFEFVAGTTPFSVTIDIPNAAVSPHTINPSGDDTLEADVEIRALRPLTATPAVTVTVINDLATIS